MSHTLNWKPLNSKQEFDELLESSRTKPALVFKHRPSSPESSKVKQSLERDWTISPEQIDLFLVDVMKDKEVINDTDEQRAGSSYHTHTHSCMNTRNLTNL